MHYNDDHKIKWKNGFIWKFKDKLKE